MSNETVYDELMCFVRYLRSQDCPFGCVVDKNGTKSLPITAEELGYAVEQYLWEKL